MSVSSEERKRRILERLGIDGKVRVPELSAACAVSEETVRRDLLVLEKEGRVRRVYGGAVAAEPRLFEYEPPYLQRRSLHAEAKARIGRAAAGLVSTGDTIAIDVGTTTLELARAIRGRQRLTVLTNSIAVAYELMESIQAKQFTGKIIVIGGELNPEQQSLSGVAGERMLADFRVDKAFISIGGLSLQRGISDYDLAEAGMSRRLIDFADRTIVLADDSKLEREAFAHIAPLERAHTVVCNAPAPKEWLPALTAAGLEWIVADE